MLKFCGHNYIDTEDVDDTISHLEVRIEQLEKENARLREFAESFADNITAQVNPALAALARRALEREP